MRVSASEQGLREQDGVRGQARLEGSAELAARDIALERDRQTIPKRALHLIMRLAGARGAKPREIGSNSRAR